VVPCRTAPVDAKRFREALQKIRTLTTRQPRVALRRLRSECAKAGIAVVFLPDIGKTPASGAARWADADEGNDPPQRPLQGRRQLLVLSLP
jgi:HTH-type transcriptional regulator / antitoxin HigA